MLEAIFLETILDANGFALNLNQPFNIALLVVAILLIIITIAIVMSFQRIFLNAILGLIAFAIIHFGFGVKLPLIVGLIIAALFGPAGVGVMLLLKFFGLL